MSTVKQRTKSKLANRLKNSLMRLKESNRDFSPCPLRENRSVTPDVTKSSKPLEKDDM